MGRIRARSLGLTVLVLLLSTLMLMVAYAYWPRQALPEQTQVNRVVVLKSARKLLLFNGQTLVRSYRIALGFQPVGDKEQEGDGKTPEGRYTLDYRNPQSQYHLSLHISYPTPTQIKRAKQQGIAPGGMIMIHGLGRNAGLWSRFHWLVDWTAGCIAVTNEEIEEIWRVVPDGTPIEIRR